MDPDASWDMAVGLAEALLEDEALERIPDSLDCVALAELVLTLNQWVSNGGFVPKAFKR